MYSDEFLETIRSIEGDKFVELTRKKQEEISAILEKEGWGR